MNNEIEKVEFDFQVTEGKIRECLDLEKMLGRKYFYGKGGLNIAINYNIFLQKRRSRCCSRPNQKDRIQPSSRTRTKSP